MTPQEYADRIVLPTVREALDERDNLRRVYLACITANHLIDYVAFALVSAEPGFAQTSTSDQKKRFAQAKEVADANVAAHCPLALDVVRGICNGLKHPEKAQNRVGTERPHEALQFDGPDETGFDNARWEVPGWSVTEGDHQVMIDTCCQVLIQWLARLYPAQLGGIDLSWFDPGTEPPA